MKSKHLMAYFLGTVFALTTSCKMSSNRYEYGSEFCHGKNLALNERNDSTEQMREFRLHSKEILKEIYDRYNLTDMAFDTKDSAAVDSLIKQQEELFGIHSDYVISSPSSNDALNFPVSKGVLPLRLQNDHMGAIVNSIHVVNGSSPSQHDTLRAKSVFFLSYD